MARSKAQKKSVQEEVYVPQKENKAENKVAQGGDMVIVALCHPQGIIFELDHGKRRVNIKGNAANLRGLPKGVLPQGGFGLTSIPRSDWEAIKAEYSDMAIFKKGLIFAAEKREDVIAECDEKAELRHGREPVDVEHDTATTPADVSSM